ncbi:MAG: amino acid permease, partial [Lacticaseibacillus paracasei]|nr:amino acid permease [Lacticaseibacillus paracasei]
FNWLLNLNGIVSPYKTALVFVAFLALRAQADKFTSGYTFIKSKAGAYLVGGWCFVFTFICATLGFLPQEVVFGTNGWTHQLVMNIISVMVLFGFGFIMPLLARRDVKKERLM